MYDEIKNISKNIIGISESEILEIHDYINDVRAGNNETFGVKYNINKEGFRSDEFDNEGGFMFLGCSLTYGYGLEEYETWPWIVGSRFKVLVWNLALSGRGDDMCFIVALNWISELKPKVVCMLVPPPGRYEFFDLSWTEDTMWKLISDGRNPKYPWLFNNKNLYLHTMKNILAIKSICDSYDIPFILKSCEDVTGDKHIQIGGIIHKYDLARDNLHPGPIWQKETANWFINEIMKQTIKHEFF